MRRPAARDCRRRDRRASGDGLPSVPGRRGAGPPLSIHVAEPSSVALGSLCPGGAVDARACPQSLPLEYAGVRHEVVVQPYVLPGQHHFSSPEAHEAAGGPNRWNRQQGLYIYRRDRLIQSGGWNRLRTLDEHAKLARIALDIPAGADAAFRINVSKMTVGLPEGIRPQLRALVAGVVSIAQDVYRRRLAVVSGRARSEAASPSESRHRSRSATNGHISSTP